MKLPLYRTATLLIICTTAAALCLSFAVKQSAQTTVQLPSRLAHVNDFANVIDDATRLRLENVLANLQLKTGIQFDVATVESTGGQDIFDYSEQLAQSWHVVGRAATGKKLLMVLSVNDKTSFTQFSKAAQREMPEGVLGEISQRLRGYLNSGRASEGLNAAVDYFVSSIAGKQGFTVEELNAPGAVATNTPAAAEAPPEVLATPQPSPVAIAVSTPSDSSAIAKSTRPRTLPKPVNNTVDNSANNAANNADESEEVELTLTLPVAARVAALKKFLDTHPDSTSRTRAMELLISAHAAWGDELLKKGDSAGGNEQLLLAISEAPADSSEKLFSGVISQIPLNLYLRGERATAETAARNIVTKFGADPKRLLAVAGFYIAVERGDDAQQLARQAIRTAPDLAEAHQALGMALHVSMRLDEAAAEYKRALELDPQSRVARRKLADLRRAFGKNDEAVALYREEIAADPRDKAARAGLVISLLDSGHAAEAKTEMETALQADPKNLPLLASAAYWFAAHNQYDAAMDFANQAIALEPRFTWSQLAMARSLIATGKPLAAERVIRFARLYGKFPTLDYELANALVAAGLYDEGAELLMQTFQIKNNQIETRLGGRIIARASGFMELLAPERQASLFQLTAADSEANAKLLKDLLVFATTINASGDALSESSAVAAAKEFAGGSDAARAHRQVYAASRLLQKGIGFQAAWELAEAARAGADAALTVPALTVVVQADEYRDIRAQALASGGTPEIPDAPANVLSNIFRGHIEDIAGWALFNSDKVDQSVDHLNRAVNILPPGTPALRTSLWHLGAALERQGKKDLAVAAYIKSYNTGDPDPIRRSIIEKLYREVNGSLAGLDEKIGSAAVVPTSQTESQTSPASNDPSVKPTSSEPVAAALPPATEPTPQPKEEPQPTPAPAAVVPSPEIATPTPTPVTTTTAEASANQVSDAAKALTTFSITGSIKDANNAPLEKVVVVLISAQGTVLTTTTDEQGNYAFTVAPSEHGFRIIPSREGFSFAPVDKQLVSVSSDLKDMNFTGTHNP